MLLQDVIRDPETRDEIIAFMINNTQARDPIGYDRMGRPVMQKLHIPPHGKFVQVRWRMGSRKMKKTWR
jgi:hypothetical protein